jgi:modulator of FtsH protease HflC
MKKNAVTLAIAALLLVIFALLLFTFQVRQSEVVVLATFGKPSDTKSEPGLYFKLPWPVQSLYRFDQRVQTFEDKFSESYLADHSTLLASVYVGWRISDAKSFFPKFQGGSIDAAQRQLEGMLRSAKLQSFGSHSLADFVNSDPAQLKFGEIEKEIQASVQKQLDENNYGIAIEFLGFKKIGLPEKATESVFERMKAERNKYITEAQSEGDKQAAIIKSGAERQAADLVNNAQAAAKRIEGEGNAEAAKSLAVFQQNPELAIFQLQLEAMKNSLNQKATLIFDERTPPFDLFRNLPTANSSLLK